MQARKLFCTPMENKLKILPWKDAQRNPVQPIQMKIRAVPFHIFFESSTSTQHNFSEKVNLWSSRVGMLIEEVSNKVCHRQPASLMRKYRTFS
jgi:hypothetical protein